MGSIEEAFSNNKACGDPRCSAHAVKLETICLPLSHACIAIQKRPDEMDFPFNLVVKCQNILLHIKSKTQETKACVKHCKSE